MPESAYVHLPFCRHRCGYCNFTVVAGRDHLVGALLDALERELAGLEAPRPVSTVYVGGGTPTHLAAEPLRRALGLVRYWFPLRPGGEFTVEANPVDIDPARVRALADHGVTRVSLGVQSFAARKLATLERDHDRHRVERAAALLRPAIPSLSLDLIFGAPGETIDAWREDLGCALALEPDHISTYGLTFEKGTSFWSRRMKGLLQPVAEDAELAMYELAIDTLTAAGFEHYEVSNFARPGCRSRHNETYWLGGEYYAAGPGAARHVDGTRESNHRSTTRYMSLLADGQSPVDVRERLGPEQAARERLVFALRRLEGVERQWFENATGFSVDQLVQPELARYVELGLVEDTGTTVRLTRRGLVVSDSLWPAFLADD